MTTSYLLREIKDNFSDTNNIFLFLLLITPFIYIESLFSKVDLPRYAYVALMASTWFLTWLIQINYKKASINWNPLFLIIIFLLFFASLSYLWGRENMTYQAELYFYTSLVILCFMGMQVKTESIHRFILIMSISAAICAIIGILQNFNINIFNYKQTASPASTFINKNYAANFFDLILPVVIILFLISKNRKDAWISAFTLSMIISYLLLTKSRGTYLAIFVTLSLLLISIQLFPWLKIQTKIISKNYKQQILFIIFIPFLLFLLPNLNVQLESDKSKYANFFSKTSTPNSISLRIDANQNSLDLLRENFVVGVGLGGFQSRFRPYTQSILAKNKIFADFNYLHNDPLQLFIELGIIGGMAALIFLTFLFRFSFSNLKYKYETNNIRINTIHLSFMIAITASLTHSLISFPYHQPTAAAFMALWIGFILNFLSKKSFISSFIKYKIIKTLMLIASVIFLLAITHFYYKYIESSIYMNQSFTTKNCGKASELAILSNNIYAKDYFSQSQGINIIGSCPVDTTKQLLFAERVLKNNPTHPYALYLAGISYLKLENYELSYKTLKSLIFLYPRFFNAYTLIGHVFLKQKNYTKAKSYYEHVLKLAPNNHEAINMLHQLSVKGY